MDANLVTGASRYSNAYSEIVADISAPNPDVYVASWRIKALFVFLIDDNTNSLSQGIKDLKSMISTEFWNLSGNERTLSIAH